MAKIKMVYKPYVCKRTGVTKRYKNKRGMTLTYMKLSINELYENKHIHSAIEMYKYYVQGGGKLSFNQIVEKSSKRVDPLMKEWNEGIMKRYGIPSN
jgi:hypothetical protein